MKHSLRFWCVAALLLLSSLAFGSVATADGPVNPYRTEAMAIEQQYNRLFRKGTRIALFGVSFEEIQTPSIGQSGIWTVNVDPQLIADYGQISDIRVEFRYDNSMYFFDEDFSGTTIVSPDFVAPGYYEIVVFVTLESGAQYAGVQAVEIPEDGVHPTVEQKVQQIVLEKKVPGNDWQTALNLHDWLTHNAYYDDTLSYYGAEGVLFRGYGVCDSYSKAYQLMLNEADIPNERVTSYNHAWNIVQLGGKWYHIDVTWDDPGRYLPECPEYKVTGNEGHDYFCLNDELIYGMFDDSDNSHQNGATMTGQCNSLDAWYPIYTGAGREYGVYLSAPNILNYADLMVAQVQNGNSTFTISANDFYPTGVTETGSGYSYSGYNATNYTAKEKRFIFATGLSAQGLPLNDNDTISVNVSFNWSDLMFSVTVLGWKNTGSGQLDLPDDLTEIGERAFEGTDAANVLVPEGCLTIGDYAFANSSVQCVTIPNAQTEIGEGAFDGCSPLMIIAPDGSNAADYAEANDILRLRP